MAKFVGSYAAIAGVHEPYAFIAFTGFSQVYEYKRPPLDNDMNAAAEGRWERGWAQFMERSKPTCTCRRREGCELAAEELFTRFERYDRRNYLMAACIACFPVPATP